ncbi:hypothetical protein AB6A40_000923 [Gnathostoma spinigerum]|uniref:Uncharacterized protein n=1 Tax=Gnathostoma spinigerum TaxID=75299 RepID=A0ABD6E7S0_9BILA
MLSPGQLRSSHSEPSITSNTSHCLSVSQPAPVRTKSTVLGLMPTNNLSKLCSTSTISMNRQSDLPRTHQVSSSDESDNDERVFVALSSNILKKLKNYDRRWFKEIAASHPEYFVDQTQYAILKRSKC